MRRIFFTIALLFVATTVGATTYFYPTSSTTPGGPLTVAITGTPASGPTTLATAFVTTISGGTLPYVFSWTFGDGGTASIQNPSHNYTSPGTYSAVLTVTDGSSTIVQATKTVLATGATYYVAKTGNDTNNGLTTSTPFLTLTRCQTAMRTGLKVCTIRNGTYTLGANLVFNSSDNNEQWVSFFGEAPLIDGNSATFNLQVTGTSGLQFLGVAFNNLGPTTRTNFPFWGFGFTSGSAPVFRWNTFTNCNQACIELNGIANAVVDSNVFNGLSPVTTTSSFFDSAVTATFGASNGQFTHNLCENMTGGCVQIDRGPTDPTQNNNLIDRNISTNILSGCFDCGGYYLFDPTSGTGDGPSIGNKITNNACYNCGSDSAIGGTCTTGQCLTKGVYLDQQVSNTLVSGNVLGNKSGNWPIFLHCGGHNTISFNILDASDTGTLSNGAVVGYQNGCSPTGTMTSNAFNHNIVYDSGAWSNIAAGMFWISGAGLTNPTSTTNLYWSPTGNAPNPSGVPVAITDANSFNADPLFVAPASNNYSISLGSPAYADIGWHTLPTDLGPIDSPFVSN